MSPREQAGAQDRRLLQGAVGFALAVCAFFVPGAVEAQWQRAVLIFPAVAVSAVPALWLGVLAMSAPRGTTARRLGILTIVVTVLVAALWVLLGFVGLIVENDTTL
jgi:hypothetical protein